MLVVGKVERGKRDDGTKHMLRNCLPTGASSNRQATDA